ncbi:MAG: gephyrin-like molybdotransferase Glp [Thermodesulfobacteriota bacterium]
MAGRSPRDMLGRQGLTPVAEASSILMAKLADFRPGSEITALATCLDRVVAREITSLEDLPPWPRSTMDGYAVRAADTFGASSSMPGYLDIKGEVLMGGMPQGTVDKGCCMKIPTGGLAPDGSDAVVMLEHTVAVDEKMIEVVKGVGSGQNLIARGEDVARGQKIFDPGHRLRPQDLGLLAGLGIKELELFCPVRVGILSTGDEIVPWHEDPPAGKIRDINSITLAALATREHTVVKDYGIAPDSFDGFLSVMEKATAENDVVLFSGGSSVGMRDLGERVIETMGNPGILVHGVALKPGKPIIIGLHDKTVLFGLPGHPVSAMVCFELFVKQAIKKLSGLAVSGLPAPTVTARLSRNINSAAGRLDLIRVRLKKLEGYIVAEPVLGKSGAMSTLARADGFFFIEEPLQGLSQDDCVEVHLFK